jgi:preprotein translocase subunit SecD
MKRLRIILIVGPLLLLWLVGVLFLIRHFTQNWKPAREFTYRIGGGDSEAASATRMQDTISAVRRRLNARRRIAVEAIDQDTLVIRLPRRPEAEYDRVKSSLARQGRLLFCLVNEDPEARAKAASGVPVPGHTPFLPSRTGLSGQPTRWRGGTFTELAQSASVKEDWFLVENLVAVSGEDLDKVHPDEDERSRPAIGFSFRGAGRKQFEEVTEANRGRGLAIILDDELFTAPTIQSRISGTGIIQGDFTAAEVADLISVLQTGPLPYPLTLVSDRVVAP